MLKNSVFMNLLVTKLQTTTTTTTSTTTTLDI